jgi:hypothetical protein
MLESLGHSVRIVHDGRAAYEAARAEPPTWRSSISACRS